MVCSMASFVPFPLRFDDERPGVAVLFPYERVSKVFALSNLEGFVFMFRIFLASFMLLMGSSCVALPYNFWLTKTEGMHYLELGC